MNNIYEFAAKSQYSTRRWTGWCAKETSGSGRSAESAELISEFYILRKNPTQPVACQRTSTVVRKTPVCRKVPTGILCEYIGTQKDNTPALDKNSSVYWNPV
jgi:hypothetical protein